MGQDQPAKHKNHTSIQPAEPAGYSCNAFRPRGLMTIRNSKSGFLPHSSSSGFVKTLPVLLAGVIINPSNTLLFGDIRLVYQNEEEENA